MPGGEIDETDCDGANILPVAPVDTIMNIQDSCLRVLVGDVLSTNIKSNFRTLMNQTVIGNHELMITFQDMSFGPGSILAGAMTQLRDGRRDGKYYLMGTLYLNSDYMNGASNEFKTVVIYHEILHAYFLKLGGLYTPGSVQHEAIASSFRNSLISALEANGVSPGDASALAWFGLQETGMWELYSNKSTALATIQRYMKGGDKGIKCQ